MMEMIQRDRESPAWTILLQMSQIRMFLLNLWSKKTVQQSFIVTWKSWKEKLKKFLRCAKKTKGSEMIGEKQLNSLSEATGLMSNKFEEYERQRQKKDKTTDTMKNGLVNINKKIGEDSR